MPGLVSRPALDNNTSLGMSSVEVEDKDEEEDLLKDIREWMKVIGAFEQPKLVYNFTQKHFERYVLCMSLKRLTGAYTPRSISKPSLFPDPSHKNSPRPVQQRYVGLGRLRHRRQTQSPLLPISLAEAEAHISFWACSQCRSRASSPCRILLPG